MSGLSQTARRYVLRLATILLTGGAAICSTTGNAATIADKRENNVSSTRLILLGTAAGPIARKTRSQPASAIQIGSNIYLIDAGDGVARQIVSANMRLSQVRAIFLTHLHFDHTAGLAPLLGYIWLDPAVAKLDIYGPPGTVAFVEGAVRYLDVSQQLFAVQLPKMRSLVELAAPREIDLSVSKTIFENDEVRVTAVENSHFVSVQTKDRLPTMGSYAFRFDTKDKSIVFTGDTGPSKAVELLAEGADILVSEVIDVEAVMEMLRARYGATDAELAAQLAHHLEEHLSPEEVGKLAAAAGVKTVVLTHIGTGVNEIVDSRRYIEGIRRYFKGHVVLGSDLQTFP